MHPYALREIPLERRFSNSGFETMAGDGGQSVGKNLRNRFGHRKFGTDRVPEEIDEVLPSLKVSD